MSRCIFSVCLLLLLTAIANCTDIAADVKIYAKPGDNVTLFPISDRNWTSFECRRKSMPDGFPLFKDRVKVLRDGNMSVVLTNVTHNNSGVYIVELLDSRDDAKPLCVFSIILKVTENMTIDAEPGDDVTLFSTPDLNLTSFECSRNSILVVKFRHNKTMPDCCPQFKGRVQVLRDGNLSVVLTNVTHNDSGVYTCELEPLRVLNITLTVAGVVVCILIVCFIYRKTEWCREVRTESPEAVPVQYRPVSNGLDDPGGDLAQMEALATSRPRLSESE